VNAGRLALGLGSGALVALVFVAPTPDAEARSPTCPGGMALVDPSRIVTDASLAAPSSPYCVDRYEASLVEVGPAGEHALSGYETVRGRRVKAVSRPGAVPQAYISEVEADAACKASHKRLCTEPEWTAACRGKRPTLFPYGDERRAGYCNDSGVSPLAALFPGGGPEVHGPIAMNDPRLNALPGTVSRTGAHPHCKSSWGTYDMVGNVHEWVDDPAGTFLGGYYLDTHINGDGCAYKTGAHDATYHDYSTGFRCCADPKGLKRGRDGG
jgi:hypothetical protein